jgi:salicylate---CoA ligase
VNPAAAQDIQPGPEGTVPWPAEAARRYVARGWWRGLALGTELWDAASARLGAPAVIDGEVRLSYSSVLARADALASTLTGDLGLRRGDRIVVQLPNCWQFVVLLLGCLRAGVVPVMALPGHRRHELAYLAGHSQAAAIAVPGQVRGFDHQQMAAELVADCPTLRLVLTTSETVRPGSTGLTALCAEPADADAARRRWDADPPGSRDVALFLLSGGTTGLPKLIARTHDDYAYNARASAELCRLGPHTVYLVALPASHNFPLACPGILGTMLSGGRVVMLPSPEPERAFAVIAAERVTVTAAVPAIAQRWIRHAREHGTGQHGTGQQGAGQHSTGQQGAGQLRTLTLLQVGGARLADEIARQVRPVLTPPCSRSSAWPRGC